MEAIRVNGNPLLSDVCVMKSVEGRRAARMTVPLNGSANRINGCSPRAIAENIIDGPLREADKRNKTDTLRASGKGCCRHPRLMSAG
jgi:hypothetical protein